MKIRTTFSFKIRRIGRTAEKSMPEIYIGVKKYLMEKTALLRQDRYEKEIYSSCILLRNLAIVHSELPMSLDYILEMLMEGSGKLKEIYADILSAYRNGRGDDSFKIMQERVPAAAGRNFAGLLSQLDKINPAELISYMQAFEETIAAARTTKGVKLAEKKSLIITAVSTASIFVIMLNFTIVVVFMNALEMLGQIM